MNVGTLYFEAPREKHPGTVLVFSRKNGRLLADEDRPGTRVHGRRATGLLPNGLTVDEYLDSLCGR